jgi:hypothetical protein
MATCLGITTEIIRSRIVLSGVSISTPYVRAWSVDKSRGRLSTQFSATVEIQATSSFVPGSDIEIYATVNGVEDKIFTGVVESTQIQPSFDKAGYWVLSISGADKMKDLEDETFSRRLRSDSFALFVAIESGPQNRPSRGFSIDKKVRGGKHTYTSSTPRPNRGEHTELTYMPKRGSGKYGEFAKIGGIGPGDGAGSSGGLAVHDHSSLDLGGPAFGVYSTD